MLRCPSLRGGVVQMPPFFGDSFRIEDEASGEASGSKSLPLPAPSEAAGARKVLKAGLLKKRSAAPPRVWQSRWVVLESTSLIYFDKEESHAQQKRPKGAIPLDGCTVKAASRCDFKVRTPSRTYDLRAGDSLETQAWLEEINAAVQQIRQEQSRSRVRRTSPPEDVLVMRAGAAGLSPIPSSVHSSPRSSLEQGLSSKSAPLPIAASSVKRSSLGEAEMAPGMAPGHSSGTLHSVRL